MDDVRRLANGIRRVLESIDSALDAREVLYGLVEVAVDVVGCDRAAILALDGNLLVPRAVWGRRTNQELFRRFRRMAAIPVDSTRRAVVEGDGVFVIDDAATSEFVPKAWLDAFHSTSIALVPVRSEGAFHGLLAVDYIAPHEFTSDELDLVRALAELARVAMRSAVSAGLAALLRDRSRAVHRGLAQIDIAKDAAAIIEATEAAVTAALPNATGVLSAADADGPEPRRGFVDTPIVAGDHRLWLRSAAPVDIDDVIVAEALAVHAARALATLQARSNADALAAQLDVVARLPDLLVGDVIVDRARGAARLLLPRGIEVQGAAFRDERIADLAGARTLTHRELAFLNRLVVERRSLGALDPFGLAGVVIPQHGRAIGLLIVKTQGERQSLMGSAERSALDALARATGHAVAARGLHLAVRQAERRASIQTTRIGIAEQLGAAAATSIQRLWTRTSDELRRGNDVSVGAFTRMRTELAEAGVLIHVLSGAFAMQRVHEAGLVEALRELAADVERVGSTTTVLRIDAAVRDVADDLATAVFGVVYEALALQHSARSTVVVVTVDTAPLRVTVRDDGVPLSQRADAMRSPAVALATIRARVGAADGTVQVRTATPRGVLITAVFANADKTGTNARPSHAAPSV